MTSPSLVSRTLALATFLSLAPAASLEAQCSGGTTVQDACRTTLDLVHFMAPQFSGALAGGNATLAQGGALGGPGTFAVAIRSTIVSGKLPRVSDQGFSLTGASATTYAADNQFVPALSVDGAFGVFRGIPMGLTHVGGVDVLVSATYMRAIDNGQVKVELAGSNTNFGFGGRLGIIEETALLPGIGLTYLKRDMPRFSLSSTISGGSGASGTIAINDLLVKTTAYRLTAAKAYGSWRLSGGVGSDAYRTDANIRVVVQPGSQTGTGAAGFSMTRTNVFVGASYDVLVFKVAGELGLVSGGSTPELLNDFGSSPNQSRTYFTLGLRLGI